MLQLQRPITFSRWIRREIFKIKTIKHIPKNKFKIVCFKLINGRKM